ncbi:MAG: family transcriptional regulator, cyclic receptor protein [Solirubrobacteraceae bacterium]|jgi:CRP-like cAMP-binding protein|nr:family transcriptional regulator, cyclic receptor protein [Solirubrobacteraceae bacterium]
MIHGSPSPAAAAARGTAERPTTELVQLLDVEPELEAGLSGGDLELVRRRLVFRSERLPEGSWRPPADRPPALGGLLTEGIVLRTTSRFGRSDVQLFGPGDLVDGPMLVDPRSAWTVVQSGRVAVLDDRFLVAARHWPRLTRWLVSRLCEARADAHAMAAIVAMPRVEERLLALMCHLAARWGRVTLDGVTIALPVTHAVLGALVGARRPTVSLALAALNEQGLLRRRCDGRWLLPPESSDWPTTGIPSVRSAVAAPSPGGVRWRRSDADAPAPPATVHSLR